MEKVHCGDHGSLCLLKTGVRDGPNKGKSFYVCATKGESPCGFTRPVDIPSSHCLQHGSFLVELQALVKQPERGDYKLYYRCTKSKADGARWCGRIPWQGQKPRELPRNEISQPVLGNQFHSKPERNPFKILNENLEPSAWKQVHEERQERRMVEEKLKARGRNLEDESKILPDSWKERELPVGMKVKKTYERKRVDSVEETTRSEKELRDQLILKDGHLLQEKSGENEFTTTTKNHIRSSGDEVELLKPPASSDAKVGSRIEQGTTGSKHEDSADQGVAEGKHKDIRAEGAITEKHSQKGADEKHRDLISTVKHSASRELELKTQATSGESYHNGKTSEPKRDVCSNGNQTTLKDGAQMEKPGKGLPSQSCLSEEGPCKADLKIAKSSTKSAGEHPCLLASAAKTQTDILVEKATTDQKEACNKGVVSTAQDDDDDDDDDEIIFVSSKPGMDKASGEVVVPRSAQSSIRPSLGAVQRTITSFPGFGHVPPVSVPQHPTELHNQLKTQLKLKKATLATVNVQALPDKGQRLLKQVKDLEDALGALNLSTPENPETGIDLKDVAAWKTTLPEPCNPFSRVTAIYPSTMPLAKPLSFQDQRASSLGLQGLSSGSHQNYSQVYGVNPQWQGLYGGRMTEDRLCAVRNATSEAIDHLHKSLESCPSPETTVDDPPGLKVPLLLHQKQALAWLLWREAQKPSGGILADDMGLGKTLTMIALILAQKKQQKVKEKEDKKLEAWISKNDSSIVPSRGTLIICPASLIHHWKKEVERRVSSSKLKVYLFHGPNRERDSQTLADYDIVVTTYSLVAKEIPVMKEEGNSPAKDLDVEDKALQCSTLLRIAWARVILDEAHNIKNPKVQTSIAVCKLRAGTRWAVTGTPIQNNLLDMYSLLKFLRCSPFDEFKLWKNQVDNGSKKGGERLNILTKNLLLRRTKDQLDSTGKPLVLLPQRRCEVHRLKLSEDEQSVYNVLFARSRSTLQSYLKRHEDKGKVQPQKSDNPFERVAQEFGSSQQEGQVSTQQPPQGSSTVHILSLLLRLRQCCCHLALLKMTLDQMELKNEGITLSLEEQLNALTLSELETPDPKSMVSLNGTSFKADLFENTRESSKISCLLLKLKAIRSSPDVQKSVIVSQWTSMLKIVAVHLKRIGLSYATIDGSVNPKLRMDMVEEFNTNPRGPQVMLVSLCAGGVGLNLIGGNHLFLLDMHWNPALEDQACDRIYRVGQLRDVVIHRFVCEDTVEGKIADLQEKKKELAKKVLSGTGEAFTKLTLADLRVLFGV
ncbi:transcription termination factor 2 [Lissotriton helveticus]